MNASLVTLAERGSRIPEMGAYNSPSMWTDIEEDKSRAWIDYADAVNGLSAVIGQEAAIAGLFWRVLNGLTIVTCKSLEYASVFSANRERVHAWPAQRAGIVPQMIEAIRTPNYSGFTFDWQTGNGRWNIRLSGSPARVNMFGAQVDSTTLPLGVTGQSTVAGLDGAQRTGLPGRPSTSQTAISILTDRARTGDMLERLGIEARAINQILRSNEAYVGLPHVTDRGLENGLRKKWNELHARNDA